MVLRHLHRPPGIGSSVIWLLLGISSVASAEELDLPASNVVSGASASPGGAASLPPELAAWRRARNAASPPGISPEHLARALAGEQVTGVETDGGPGRGWVLQRVELEVEELWSAIVDNAHQTAYFQVDQSRVLGGSATDRLTFQLLELPLVTDRWWIVRQRFNGALYRSSGARAWEVSWTDHLDDEALNARAQPPQDSRPVVGAEGSWFLVDLGGGQTLVEYYCWTDIGGLVPASVANRFAAGAVNRHVDSVVRMAREHECAQEGQVRPDGSPL